MIKPTIEFILNKLAPIFEGRLRDINGQVGKGIFEVAAAIYDWVIQAVLKDPFASFVLLVNGANFEGFVIVQKMLVIIIADKPNR